MKVEIQPEPEPAERAAVEQALLAPAPDRGQRGAWWRDGLRALLRANEPDR
ncbi:MAG: hypothetical protein R3C15_02710 [Thermoleophilia bacterium]